MPPAFVSPSHETPRPATSPSNRTVNDPLLSSFLKAKNDETATAQMEQLIQSIADPIIAATARRYFPRERTAAEDVRSEVVCCLVGRLQTARTPCSPPLPDYVAYVRVAARHACWRYQNKRRETCFSALGSSHNASGDLDTSPDAFLAASTNVEAHITRRAQLDAVWSEVLLLPPTQRAALLLNLRGPDNSSALRFLSTVGATSAQLATALGISTGELAELLPQLPLNDVHVAERLRLPAQEIRTLRLAARRRLARRQQEWI